MSLELMLWSQKVINKHNPLLAEKKLQENAETSWDFELSKTSDDPATNELLEIKRNTWDVIQKAKKSGATIPKKEVQFTLEQFEAKSTKLENMIHKISFDIAGCETRSFGLEEGLSELKKQWKNSLNIVFQQRKLNSEAVYKKVLEEIDQCKIQKQRLEKELVSREEQVDILFTVEGLLRQYLADTNNPNFVKSIKNQREQAYKN